MSALIDLSSNADGILANMWITSSIKVSSKFAGHANHPATAGNNIPEKAATAEKSIAKGTSGTIIALAKRATAESWLKVNIISGKVIISADKVSITTPPRIFGSFLNNLADICGAIIRTPKKAKNDRYQPRSPQT